MNIRRTATTRRAMTAVAITTGLVFTVAGCGGGDGDGDKAEKSATSTSSSGQSKGEDDDKGESDQTPEADEVLAEVKGEENITLTVTSAVRDEGGFVTVSGKVTNNGGRFWAAANWRGEERELNKNGSSVAGANLIDNVGKKKYLVLRDTEGRCLCTKFTGGVKPSQTADWFAQFPAPPEGTDKVTFQVGSMPPAPIEIAQGE
ncbi:hypothetical protein [Streptomyces venezuelae]|uniref:Secreted protein n=1 Tax=Streptomyces venezuelae TaxID=54571 RepID=A0A5P2BZD3_STRVZ|nr:hypothetical protein [Streptomyces venezuelae]QES34381.1 hypothetical protein DEJ48_14100 [Streptomyces venezuelae]